MNIAATLDNARRARSENIAARATGNLTHEKVAGQTAFLAGSLRLPETRYRIVREGEAQVAGMTGGRRTQHAGRHAVSRAGRVAGGGSHITLRCLDLQHKPTDI